MRIFLFAITTILCSNCFSQKYANNWIFGESAGLNFSSPTTSPIISSIKTRSACASISDSSGNLLFYTNGEKVWNKDHIVMPNGDSLHIGLVYPGYGSGISQGVIIIPKPFDISKYYIFYLVFNYLDEIFGVEYSIVDMELEDRVGDVSGKNLKLFDTITSGKMYAVKHANGRDWWLLFEYGEELIPDESYDLVFTRFLITPLGFEGPFYQDYGPPFDPEGDNFDGLGEMVFSEDGSKLAYTRGYYLDIYDFDRCTGELSNQIEVKVVTTESGGVNSCAFSEDGSKVYVSDINNKTLYQLCLDCGGSIESTKQIIYNGPSGFYSGTILEIGPDNKIYFATVYNSIPSDVFSPKNQNLCVINYPNLEFPFCDFDTNTVSLGDNRVIEGLPNMPNYNLGALVGSECDTLVGIDADLQQHDLFSIYPNPTSDKIHLSSNKNEAFFYTIKNNIGAEMLSGNFVQQQSIDIKFLPSGMYFIEIKNAKGEMVFTEKIVKQ